MTVELRPVPRLEWEQILRRIRWTGVIAGTGRMGANGLPTRGGVSGALCMAVALDMSSYGDFDGANIWPGDATIAVDLECSLDTVVAVRRALLRLGLIQRVSGRRRGRPGEEYRLTLPVDLLDQLEVLTPAAHQMAAQREREKRRGKPKASSGGSTGPTQALPDEGDSGGPLDPPNLEGAASSGGSSGPRIQEFGGSTGAHSGGPVDPSTYPGPHQVSHQPNSDEDLDTDVTGPRATTPHQDPISSVDEVDPSTRWVARARVPNPAQCPHGLPLRTPDGCAACRRAPNVTDTGMWPTIAPPSPNNVIPFPVRSAS